MPNRVNIVITNDPDISFFGCDMVNSIDDAIYKANYWSDSDEIFIIGGGSIYNQFFDMANRLYITKVHKTFDGDTYFPPITDNICMTQMGIQGKFQYLSVSKTFIRYGRTSSLLSKMFWIILSGVLVLKFIK